jgi:pyruvate kinase
LGIQEVPVVQKTIIKKALQGGIPVITATQMLTSMISSPFPTRAEVSDIANAVLDGTDAVMLSDETTVGSFAYEAINVLDSTIRATEVMYPWYTSSDVNETHKAIAASATNLSRSVGADALVAFTESGLAARMISRQRPQTRIIGITSNPRTYRRLAVCWGVEPFFVGYPHSSSDKAMAHFYRKAIEAGLLQPDDRFVVTIGMHSNKSGYTNQIQLMDRECMERLQAALKGGAV